MRGNDDRGNGRDGNQGSNEEMVMMMEHVFDLPLVSGCSVARPPGSPRRFLGRHLHCGSSAWHECQHLSTLRTVTVGGSYGSVLVTVSTIPGTVHEPSNPRRNRDEPTKKTTCREFSPFENGYCVDPSNAHRMWPSWWTRRESNSRPKHSPIHFLPCVPTAVAMSRRIERPEGVFSPLPGFPAKG